MVSTVEVKISASQPQKALPPWFAFKDSPSSLRIIDLPKKCGEWEITGVQVQVLYPNNQTISKNAVRNGSVWVATVEGSDLAGKVSQGYQIVASCKDENNNPIEGIVMGVGDVFIMDVSNDIRALVGKNAVRFLNELPTNPVVGDMMYLNNKIQIFDGEKWAYDIIPSKTSDLVNDSGFISAAAISDKRDYDDLGYSILTMDTDPAKFGIDNFTITISGQNIELSKFNIGNHIWYNSNADFKIQALAKDNFMVYFPNEYIPTTSFPRQSDADTSWNLVHDGVSFTVTATPLTSTSIALANAVPWRTSELNNDAGFVTTTQISPCESISGWAENAVTTLKMNATKAWDGTITEGAGLEVQLSSDVRPMVYQQIMPPWELASVSGATYNPAIELVWGYFTLTSTVSANAYEGWGWKTSRVGQANYAIAASEDGTPTSNFYQIKADGTTTMSMRSVTYTQDGLSIATFNGQSNIVCSRSSATPTTTKKAVGFKEEIPTKTSDLVNDNGFINASNSAITSKREIIDKTWNYTINSDDEMYGILKFYVVKDQDGADDQSYDLTSFDSSTKVWSASSSPIIIKAINKNVYALIDEDNPHTFEYDDETYDGWEFYRLNDNTIQWTIDESSPVEYIISGTRRTSTELALKDYVDGLIGDVLNEQM